MSNETLFFIFGIALAVSAVLVSFLGLKLKDFPGKAFPIVVLWFAILVGGATTFAVLHAKDEDKEKAAEFKEANKEIEKETSSGPFEEEGSKESSGSTETEEKGKEPAESEEAGATGPGGTLEISAAESELRFEETELTSKPGKVTIDFNNPSSIPHDVKIEDEAGEELGGTETIAKEEESATVELPPGTYKFFCSVPGHREAGMEGTLVVK
ncbi:MAG TPA: plastocyanin/azurin family copper-binding protein [Solirubrobacterales bacterium]|nr:plastocyanin/azurin family copper-binding protein [Solirubrobacterales bacterium]